MMRAAFQPGSLNEEERTIEVVFGTDAPVRMWTWEYGAIEEQLSFKEGEVNLSRMNSGAPVLDNHDMYGSVLDTVLGVVEKAWTDGKKGYAKLRFAKTDKAESVLGMARDGILQNLSVGYRVNKYKRTKSTEEGQLDKYRAIDWEPHEISMVAVPADYGAKVRGVTVNSGNLAIEDDAVMTRAEDKQMPTPEEIKGATIELCSELIDELNAVAVCAGKFDAAALTQADTDNSDLYTQAATDLQSAADACKAAINTLTEIIAAANGQRSITEDIIHQRRREVEILKARF